MSREWLDQGSLNLVTMAPQMLILFLVLAFSFCLEQVVAYNRHSLSRHSHTLFIKIYRNSPYLFVAVSNKFKQN